MTNKKIVLVILAFFPCGHLFAAEKPAVLTVPDDFNCIQAAIDAAYVDDTVLIKPGVYNETIKFKDGINLRGQSTDTNTVILQTDSLSSVIEVKNCLSGKISNLSLRHLPGADSNRPPPLIYMAQSNIEISDCNLSDAKGYGIFADSASRPAISNCVITKSFWTGIGIYGAKTHAILNANIITDNKSHGICVFNGASCEAKYNRCISNNGSGISINDANEECQLFKNSCSENVYYGIYSGRVCKNIAVEQNTARANNISGIYLDKCAAEANVSGNVCELNIKNGLEISGNSGGIVKSNLCRQNGGNGILVFGDSKDTLIKNNLCIENKSDGLFVRNSSHITEEGGKYNGNAGNGLSVLKSTSVSLNRNECFNNSGIGIYINDSSALTVEDNVCRQNIWQGVLVHVCKNISLLRNQCVGNFHSGIEFRAASGAAENNICRFNHENGIMASDPDANVILTANTCLNNYPSGIFFEKGVAGKVSDNICQNNPFSGIAIRGSGTNPILANNTFSNNGTWGLRVWAEAKPEINPNNIMQGNSKGASKID